TGPATRPHQVEPEVHRFRHEGRRQAAAPFGRTRLRRCEERMKGYAKVRPMNGSKLWSRWSRSAFARSERGRTRLGGKPLLSSGNRKRSERERTSASFREAGGH